MGGNTVSRSALPWPRPRSRAKRGRALIVQQGAWDMPKESMPLAAGYLKAAVAADPVVGPEFTVEIQNFRGGESLGAMARAIFSDNPPDVLAFSVFGWNFNQFGALAETYRSVRPDGWVVFGGTHVAHQAERVFRKFPQVDVVANGEGEYTFRDLLLAFLEDGSVCDLAGVPGISYRDEEGTVHTTAEAPKIENLDTIPSPFLTGAIPLLDHRGQFPYDVALMETNRGCPYKCSFCYWGGAVGQKMRDFSRERLRAELDMFGYHQIPTVVLCDSNFGMRQSDAEFVEDLVKTREKYGFPQSLETSWAKNKSKTFHNIVRRMKEQGFQSSFTVALQTLDDTALRDMGRRNMRLNEWEDLAAWLAAEGLDAYAELIWGAPGETVESFLTGYDRLSKHVSRIAVYPLLLLPNTSYVENREEHGFLTVRGDSDDFEYVLANRTVTVAENVMMQRFMFWARMMSENMYFRHIWAPLRELAGLTQSTVLLSLSDWFQDDSSDPAIAELMGDRREFTDSGLVVESLHKLYAEPRFEQVFQRWWDEAIIPKVPEQYRHLLDEVFRYDNVTRPVYAGIGAENAEVRTIDSLPHYVRSAIRFDYAMPRVLEAIRAGEPVDTEPAPVELTLAHRVGFEEYLDNHELATYYSARCLAIQELT
ncbi:KedN5 family methylcobalamin-dependent radical SAM C-methyltransferase [Lentzea sp. NPDC004782]|uniref:KedN5 family methylcobalamin-dependent radical SAM C-methyltransferase n=1 Tax=Lentzea sp. NPDC004782 TaxID=3154458 RepID=UPI0033B971F7